MSQKMSPLGEVRMGHSWDRRIVGVRTNRRFELVCMSYSLQGEDLGTFVRVNGIFLSDLIQWREEMIEGLEMGKPPDRDSLKTYKARIKRLEQELAEAKEVIAVQKKVLSLTKEEAAKEVKKKGK